MDRSGFSNAKGEIYIFYWKIAAKSNYGRSIHRYVIKYFKGLNWKEKGGVYESFHCTGTLFFDL